jgi:transcription initiation factor TFIIIB Brf1 subunit/transcription initiation factor TFIIB
VKCPLCESHGCREYDVDRRRTFVRCDMCGLVFVPEEYHLTPEQERRRYELHDNHEHNRGYVRFLSQVADVIGDMRPQPSRVLDFGCGREAVLTALLRRRGFRCDSFDPLYDRPLPPSPGKYDAVVVCEVVEHCRNIRRTFLEIEGLLEEKGTAVVRTQCRDERTDFSCWWYARDPTHINFFSRDTLEYAAGLLRKKCMATAADDIFVFG